MKMKEILLLHFLKIKKISNRELEQSPLKIKINLIQYKVIQLNKPNNIITMLKVSYSKASLQRIIIKKMRN